MKRFAFRLEAVLELRRAAEDAAKLAFANARRAADAQAAVHAGLQAAERRAKDDLAGTQRAGVIRVADLLIHHSFIASIARRTAAAKQRLSELEGETLKARDAVVAASRDRKALDKLREHRHAGWVKDGLREEQKALDENAAVVSGRERG